MKVTQNGLSRPTPRQRSKPLRENPGEDQRPLSLVEPDVLQDRLELNRETVLEAKEAAKSRFRGQAIANSLLGGIVGACFGGPVGAMIGLGALTGVGTGLYLAWNRTWRHEVGQVEVESDGISRKTDFYGSPDNFLRTSKEMQIEIAAERRPVSSKHYEPDLGLAEPSDAFNIDSNLAHTLTVLESERRLVAPAKEKAQDGQEMLTLVNSQMAAALLVNEGEVYVVEGEHRDSEQNLKYHATNSGRTQAGQKSVAVVKRDFSYTVSPFNDNILVDKLQGAGLPEGLTAVSSQVKETSTIISADRQKRQVDIPDQNSTTFTKSQKGYHSSNGPNQQANRLNLRVGSVQAVRGLVSFVGFGIAGAAATALGLIGVPAIAIGVAAGVVGLEVGRQVEKLLKPVHNPRFKSF